MDKLINYQKERKNRFRARDKPDRIRLIKAAKARFDRKKFTFHRMFENKFTRPIKEESSPVPNESLLVDKMFELIRERNVELVKAALDRIWRKNMITEKDYEAIDAAQKFIREVDLLKG